MQSFSHESLGYLIESPYLGTIGVDLFLLDVLGCRGLYLICITRVAASYCTL